MRSEIDPRNNQLLRHTFNIGATQVNPQYIDMSSVIPTIDMGQSGWARFNKEYLRSATMEFQAADPESISKSQKVIISSTDLDASYISIPPNHNCRILSIMVTFQIDYFLWLTKFSGQRLYVQGWISGDYLNDAIGYAPFYDAFNTIYSDVSWYSWQVSGEHTIILAHGETLNITLRTQNDTDMYDNLGHWTDLHPELNGMPLPYNPEVPEVANCHVRALVYPVGVQLPF